MDLYGLISPNSKLIGGIWTPDLELAGAEAPLRVDFARAPEAYSGRNLFSLVYRFNGKGLDWLDTGRETFPTKCTPSQYFSPRGLPAIAHLIASQGRPSAGVLFGSDDAAFRNLPVKGILRSNDEIAAFYAAIWPSISVAHDPATGSLVATTESSATIYWETTGGYLSNTRTRSGERVKLAGNDPGIEVRVGFKNYSNINRVVVP